MSTIEAPRTLQFDRLMVRIFPSNILLGQAAAQEAKSAIIQAINVRQEANVILATGNSQLSTLTALSQEKGIPWSKVRLFHMDEYIGIDPGHSAGFAMFLRQRFLNLLSEKPLAFFPVPLLSNFDAPGVVDQACKEYEALLRQFPADLCLLGIGENGHIAFNDPPFAYFDDPVWVKKICLSPISRRQQVNEGHFPNVETTPTHAITLTIPALLAAKKILAIVPEARKSTAVHAALFDPINENLPASILRQNGHATLYLDNESSAEI